MRRTGTRGRDATHTGRSGRGRPLRRLLLRGLLVLALGPGSLSGIVAAPDDCPDALITADVKSRILAKHPVAGLKINVETDACVVTLKGCAGSDDVAKSAVRAARKVKKVQAVKNEMSICPKE